VFKGAAARQRLMQRGAPLHRHLRRVGDG
jgi:hypothetical protein